MNFDVPKKVILKNNFGEWFVTKNFDSYAPLYKKYKKLGRALKYLGVTKEEFYERLKLQSL